MNLLNCVGILQSHLSTVHNVLTFKKTDKTKSFKKYGLECYTIVTFLLTSFGRIRLEFGKSYVSRGATHRYYALPMHSGHRPYHWSHSFSAEKSFIYSCLITFIYSILENCKVILYSFNYSVITIFDLFITFHLLFTLRFSCQLCKTAMEQL